MRICTVYGAATPPGRLAAALDEVGAALVSAESEVDRLAPDPSDDGLTRWPSDARERIAAADSIVLASPVYRASIPAILKQLLDAIEVEDLHAKPVGLVVVGYAAEHHLGVRRHVADILEWFGAVLIPTQVYCLAPAFIDGRPGEADAARLRDLAASVVRMTAALEHLTLRPMPLAHRSRSRS